MLKEFKDFIMRGNVVDLAVAVVVGGAFQDIINSLVEHMIMPIVAAVTGNINISDVVVTAGGVTFGVGYFLQAVIDFLLIALVLFLIIKGINSVHERFKKEEEPVDVEAPTAEQYLAEIRDLLAAQQASEAPETPAEDSQPTDLS